MIRTTHVLRELGRNLYRNTGTALASLLSLTLLFLLFDLFWISAGTADRFYRDLLSELRVEVFLDETLADSSVIQVSNQLVHLEGILDFEYISREQARQRLTDMVGVDLLVGYEESNPLPRSYVLTVAESHLNSGALMEIETKLGTVDGVSEVHFSREWLDKAEAAKSILLKIGLGLGALIFAAALISSANNIRLMTRARAVGFRRMLLQGAGRLFIAFPFLIESFLISGLAAVLGWGLILYGRTYVGLARIAVVFPEHREIALFCLTVAVLGAISGHLGLRKQLRH